MKVNAVRMVLPDDVERVIVKQMLVQQIEGIVGERDGCLAFTSLPFSF